MLLGIPFLSVSLFAWMLPNPFNGVIFAVVGIVLLIVATRLLRDGVRITSRLRLIFGILLFTSGWIYPHFLNTTSYPQYLYVAPLGTIPCSTLIIVIGTVLILDGIDSRTWCAILGFVGLLYGFLGVAYLHLPSDRVLILGACTILISVFNLRLSQSTIP